MKKILIVVITVVLILVALVVYKAPNGKELPRPIAKGEPVSVSETIPVDTSFCADTLAKSAGTLCAIQPSKIDSHILDVSPASGLKGDESLGFGYHVLAIPDDLAQAKGIWLHFTGSYGRAYSQRTDDYSTDVWLNELMEEGYVVIQLAYDNRFSINGDLCERKNDGQDRDNCAGEVREIGLTGKGTSPYRSTDTYNTIDYRLKTLLTYIEDTQGIDLPGNIDANNIDWSKVSVSGHSQGANQAYFIAKQRPVAFVCILAGGYDSADSVNPGGLAIADWFTTGTSVTPTSKISALLTTTDDNYKTFYKGLTQAVGLPVQQIVIADAKKYYSSDGDEVNGHAGTIKDPTLKAKRAEACFR